MYRWKTIRLFCMILLLLPLVHLAYMVSRDVYEVMDNSPDAFNRDLRAYERIDSSALPQQPIVVVGGRRVKLWHGLAEALAPRPVLMRGLGDAIVEDITHHYERLIGYYRPHSVILLTGTSEFFIRDNKSGDELANSIAALVQLDASHGITRNFYIFSPIKTPLRRTDDVKIDEAMGQLKTLAAEHSRVELLDANALLAGFDGLPDPTYFRSDGIQLNEHGYLRLTVLLQDRLPPITDNPTDSTATQFFSTLR